MKILINAVSFIKDAKAQLIKVSWPTRQELVGATFVVIIMTFVISIFIGLIDLFLSRLISWVFR